MNNNKKVNRFSGENTECSLSISFRINLNFKKIWDVISCE